MRMNRSDVSSCCTEIAASSELYRHSVYSLNIAHENTERDVSRDRLVGTFTMVNRDFTIFGNASSTEHYMVWRSTSRQYAFLDPTRAALKSYEGSIFHLPAARILRFRYFPGLWRKRLLGGRRLLPSVEPTFIAL